MFNSRNKEECRVAYSTESGDTANHRNLPLIYIEGREANVDKTSSTNQLIMKHRGWFSEV